MMVLFLAAGGGHGSDSVPIVLLSLAFVLVGAKLGGELFERMGQPSVLGELGTGILLANLAPLLGLDLGPLTSSETFAVLAELGAIVLLFHVGLESTPGQMMAVGGRSAAVAAIGVIVPMILGYRVGVVLRPPGSWMLHLVLGAQLAAPSVGITARVLSDAGALGRPFARVILGAAVIDDVLGLLVLAVISGIITGASSGTALGASAIVGIVFKAFAFLVGALVVGSFLSPRLFRGALALRSKDVVLTLALSFCFLMSWLALKAGLAPIVGAFAAGLVLEDVHFEENVQQGRPDLHDSLAPLLALLVPVFFVRMGLLVDVRSFATPGVLVLAVALTVAAIAGKLACALVVPRALSPLTVALGMLPRGEVGLIFAGIGAALMLDGHPVINAGAYAAALFMVVVTTLATPPLLLWSMRRDERASG